MRPFRFFWLLTVLTMPAALLADDKAPAAPSFTNFKDAYSTGNQALKDRKFEDAVAAYFEAEKLATTSKGKSQAANAQGWAFLKARKLEEAKKALERAVEEDGDNKVALKNLGVASFRLYDYGFSGVEELKTAVKNLEASGENQELLERAKGALSREDSYAQATATPSVSASTEGLNYKGMLALGDRLQADGKFAQATKVFKQAQVIARSPSAKAAAANRQGKVLLDSRHPLESIPYFEQAVKDQPNEKVYLNNLAFSYWVLYDSGRGTEGDLKKSVDAFYKANSLDASFHSENLKMALDELKEADPEAAKAYSVKDDDKDEADSDKADAKDDKDGDEKEDSK